MVETYANDPAKIASHDAIRGTLERRFGRRDPASIKVMCLPGAERDGEEAREVIEVYDRMGIPRENIFGVEYDREKAARLKRAGLGIHVFHGSDFQFFQTTQDGPFDIISLDYTGQQTRDTVKSLKTIAGRQLLTPNGTLIVNHAANRESSRQQARYLIRYLRQKFSHQEIYDFLRSFEEGREKEYGIELEEMRDAITLNTTLHLFDGRFALYDPMTQDPKSVLPAAVHHLGVYDTVVAKQRHLWEKAAREDPEWEQQMIDITIYAKIWTEKEAERIRREPELNAPLVLEYLAKEIGRVAAEQTHFTPRFFRWLFKQRQAQFGSGISKGILHANKQLERLALEKGATAEELAETKEQLQKALKANRGRGMGAREAAVQALMEEGSTADVIQMDLGEAILWPQLGRYLTRSVERFKYRSNKRTPMLVDVIQVNRRDDLEERMEELLPVHEDGTVTFNPSGMNVGRYFRAIKETHDMLQMRRPQLEKRVEIVPTREHIEITTALDTQHRELETPQPEPAPIDARVNGEILLTGEDVLDIYTAGVSAQTIAAVADNIPTWQKVAAFINRFNKGTLPEEALIQPL